MQLLMFSNQEVKFNTLVEENLQKLLSKKIIVYIPSRSDLTRKYFYKTLDFYKKFDIKEMIYCDIDNEYCENIQEVIKSSDIIHLSGGDTQYFINNIYSKGVDKLLIEHVLSEKLLIGVSAGAIIITPEISVSKIYDIELSKSDNYQGLSFVNFEFAPHYLEYKDKVDNYKNKYELYCCPDNSLLYINGNNINVLGNLTIKKI